MSIREESIHLAASGSAAQEKAGPKLPNPGPTLPIAEITVLIASVKSTPNAINSVQPIKATDRQAAKNTRTVVTNLLSNGNPALTGRTARGWSICRNWLRMQLAMIMSLRFFTPPLVEPVHPPDNMANISSIHVNGGHRL